MSRILILTASPTRDMIVDSLIKKELEKHGHKVSVRPCLREGRGAIIDEINKLLKGDGKPFIPDTVVVPPIRNPYSRDLVMVLKQFGLAVISRHTEPSCDKKDFEKILATDKAEGMTRAMEIYGRYPYIVDAEIVWSEDEAEILNKRDVPFKVHPVGAFTVDAYKREDVIAKYRNMEEFRKKYGFENELPILLVCSAWGFADTAPDLHIEDIDAAKKDTEGRDRHFAMIRKITELKDKWNIIISTHPGVVQKPYKDLCDELKLPLDTESISFYLNIHVDAIIHAGSTMAINMHLLNKPAYQFGDINCKGAGNWWADPEASISKVSPHFKEPQLLFNVLDYLVAAGDAHAMYKPETNANLETIADLEKGRFGNMDGNSTKRAAEIIAKHVGEFKFVWPKSTTDYTQLTIQKELRRLCTQIKCGICGEDMVIVNDSWLHQCTNWMLQYLGKYFKETPPPDVLQKMWIPPHSDACPSCSARFFRRGAE
ncbi:hypothetical protein KAR91_66235 [Candidatus Pacearchaeota archaeon]|nr:hypothetical protein [Candidatus Pacearchaeota archaeon]